MTEENQDEGTKHFHYLFDPLLLTISDADYLDGIVKNEDSMDSDYDTTRKRRVWIFPFSHLSFRFLLSIALQEKTSSIHRLSFLFWWMSINIRWSIRFSSSLSSTSIMFAIEKFSEENLPLSTFQFQTWFYSRSCQSSRSSGH